MKPILLILSIFVYSTCFSQNVQSTIEEATQKSYEENSIAPLSENLITLESDYWKAYNIYQQTAFLLMTNGEYEDILQQGVDLLHSQTELTSEDYALLAGLTSMKMVLLDSTNELMSTEEEFYSYIRKAIELNPDNPRAYFIAGIYDFYKPEMYGGGQKAKEYLAKSLELFKQDDGDITWGFSYAQEIYEQIK